MIQSVSQSESEPVGESSSVELRIQDPVRTVADFEAMRQERDALKAELAAMKGEREGTMVHSVGQRLIDGFGEVLVVVGRCDIPAAPWLLRQKGGATLHYSGAGEWLGGHPGSKYNLVGPAPDELAEAKLASELVARDLKELDAKYRQLERLHVLPLSEEVRDLPDLIDDGTKDVCHELFVRVQAEMKSTVAGRRFYVRIGLRGCEYLPLRTEGCWGDKAFKATYLPGFSSRGKGIVAVYEVETWRS